MTDEDPLRHADVGETKTIRQQKTLHGINFEPDVFYGSDRFGDARIVDVEILEDDRDGYADDVRITWEGEITKRLPERWDYCRQPRTDAERSAARRKKWIRRITRAAPLMFGVLLAVAIGTAVMGGLADVTVNGDPLVALSIYNFIGILAFVLGFAGFIAWAAAHAPGRASR